MNGRSGLIDDQWAAVRGRGPDGVSLQEVRAQTVGQWRSLLEADGFNVLTTQHLVTNRRNFLLVASKVGLRPVDGWIEVPFPELVLPVVLGNEVELVATHVPNGSTYGMKKIEHLEALYRYLVRPGDHPRVLCGDFNAPRLEPASGETITWAQRPDGTVRKSRGQRWDAAERSVLLGLEAFGMRDVFREEFLPERLPGEGTWAPEGGEARRIDHLIADNALEVTKCQYHHGWRDALSDHSAVEVDFRERISGQ